MTRPPRALMTETRPRLLDLCCKAGGCTKGYQRAGFYVVGVDHEPQPNYCGDEFYQADAMTFPLEGFAAIHASPPCQDASVLRRGLWPDHQHPRLIAPLRERLIEAGVPYVIENVVGARKELREPILLCGSSFGLRVRRHRLFESNVSLWPLPCSHSWQTPIWRVRNHGEQMTGVAYVFGLGGGKASPMWPEAMGIDWMTRPEMAEAIPPVMTEYIGRQLLPYLRTVPEKGGQQ